MEIRENDLEIALMNTPSVMRKVRFIIINIEIVH